MVILLPCILHTTSLRDTQLITLLRKQANFDTQQKITTWLTPQFRTWRTPICGLFDMHENILTTFLAADATKCTHLSTFLPSCTLESPSSGPQDQNNLEVLLWTCPFWTGMVPSKCLHCTCLLLYHNNRQVNTVLFTVQVLQNFVKQSVLLKIQCKNEMCFIKPWTSIIEGHRLIFNACNTSRRDE